MLTLSSAAAEVGDRGKTSFACLTQEAATEMAKSTNPGQTAEELAKRELCSMGPPVVVTLKVEHKVAGTPYSVWEIEEASGIFIIAPSSEKVDS